MLQPIYDKLGPNRAAVLINWHALIGCDTTGDTRGKGKKTCFNTFMASGPSMISAFSNLCVGNELSKDLADGSKAYMCSLFAPNNTVFLHTKHLRWN